MIKKLLAYGVLTTACASLSLDGFGDGLIGLGVEGDCGGGPVRWEFGRQIRSYKAVLAPNRSPLPLD